MAKPVTQAVINPISSDNLVLSVSTSGTMAAPGTGLAEYIINWGDGSTSNGRGVPPTACAHKYDSEGTYQVSLQVRDTKGSRAKDGKDMLVRGPIPTTSVLYGPTTAISCPVSSVPIPVGSTTASRQTLIDANPNATFCLETGVHFATGSNAPTSNQKFYAQYGAIIDGSTWPRPEADLDASPFKALNNGVVGVEIYNLVVRNCPSYGINSYLSASSWKVIHCEISGNRTGLSIGHFGQFKNNYIHHNIGTTGDPNPALRGGGYVISQTQGVTMDTNEVSFNGTEQKFIGGTLGTDNFNYIISNNYVHHNIGAGIWNDGYGAGGVISGNNCIFNGQSGIVTEKGKSITVSGNISSNNTESGIVNTESRDCSYTGNTIDGNRIALDLFVDLGDVGGSAWGIDLLNNIYQNNIITVPNSPGIAFAVTLGHVGIGDFTPYTNNSKSNNFNFNTYNVHDGVSGWWNFGVNMLWATWQAIPQDPAGIRNII